MPGRPKCDAHFLDPHVLHPILEVLAVAALTVAQQKTRSFFERERLHDLLSGPLGRLPGSKPNRTVLSDAEGGHS